MIPPSWLLLTHEIIVILCVITKFTGFNNTLYDVYSSIKSANALWKALDQKYKVKDDGMKKFIHSWKFSRPQDGRFKDFDKSNSRVSAYLAWYSYIMNGS
jgi:hypothetical protein